MREKNSCLIASAALAIVGIAWVLTPVTVAAGTYKVLHQFTGTDGTFLSGDLILDAEGNLYGTAYQGGAFNDGTVFRLAPNSGGTWTETVLHNFTGNDGLLPTAGLVFDAVGNLYGTTDENGGVFKLAPNSDGTWTESGLAMMFRPSAGTNLIFDAAGNLYGQTEVDGAFGNGRVFELTPNPDGTWTEKDLYSFTGGADGISPGGRLSIDAAGQLYGAAGGGTGGGGVIFKLSPNSDGTWTESVLHSFPSFGNDGSVPLGGVTLDAAGNLYGTTASGGNVNCRPPIGCGVVFKLDTSGKYSVLHRFSHTPAATPYATVILDAAGNLYGTTNVGGPLDSGVVFKMAPQKDGSYKFCVLHVFWLARAPAAPLVFDKAGNLYGTTSDCGIRQKCIGIAFEITH